MVKRLSNIINFKNIPKNIIDMLNGIPQPGIDALYDYYDENSNFFIHANPNLLINGIQFHDGDNYIYHYTSINSLKKIIKSHEFLVKSFDFMNDNKEFVYTYEKSKRILKDLGALDNEISIFENSLINKNPFKDCYIWSFTENGNSQNLFGNYSSDKNGIAMKFKSSTIMKEMASHFAKGKANLDKFTYGNAFTFPLRVVYDEKIQNEWLIPILNEYLSCLRCQKYDPYDMNTILNLCLADLVIISMCFKNPLLYQEEEIRFVAANINENNKKHPEKVINKIPFVTVPFKNKILSEVILQPNNDIDTMELKDNLKRYGFVNTKIKMSELPY